MDFKDYGIIDWFNDSKGFGVVATTHHGDVFIHIKDINGTPNFRNYLIIEEVIWNSRKNRYEGKNATFWDNDINHLCEIIFQNWLSNKPLEFNADIKWIIQNGTSSIISKIIEVNYSFWCKNVEFINFIREFTPSHDIFTAKTNNYEKHSERITRLNNILKAHKESDETSSIIASFIYKVWTSQKSKEFDENLKWLIKHGQVGILNKIIYQDRQKWLINEEFINYIKRTNFSSNEFKENFLYEVCMFAPDFKYNETVKWVFENARPDKIIKILTNKLGYTLEIVGKIYAAFFPEDNIKYYQEKTQNTEWSYDFRIDYIIQNESSKFDLFSKLFIKELEASEKSLIKRIIKKKEAHAATDLANFVFCPASYAVNKTFYIDIQENENIFIGTREHERQRLLSLSDYKGIEENTYLTGSPNYYNDFKRIRNSKCISQGHSDKTPTIYYSKKRNLSGIPDYIFKDGAGFFAVEEKYTFKDFEELTNLYPNHKTQALVYLYGLDEFNFNEVFVIYWYIKKHKVSGEYFVYNYRLFKLTKNNENKKIIIDVCNDLESIQNRVPYPFDAGNINYRKCIRCNYFPYCEYKKGNISKIELEPCTD
jgi:hypothetical protein